MISGARLILILNFINWLAVGGAIGAHSFIENKLSSVELGILWGELFSLVMIFSYLASARNEKAKTLASNEPNRDKGATPP